MLVDTIPSQYGEGRWVPSPSSDLEFAKLAPPACFFLGQTGAGPCLLQCSAVDHLSQHALLIDVAAKVLAANLASLICIAAAQQADLPAASRRCNRAYAAALLQRTLPRMVLMIGDLVAILADVLRLLGANTQRFIPGRSRPRPVQHVKPHPSAVYKG